MSFALLGSNIIFSYSPLLHNIIGHYQYQLADIKKEELKDFIEEGNFSGLNVTMPFKEEVLSLIECDQLSKTLGACNTIYRKDGKLLGTNTDFFGFIYLLSYHKIDLSNKKVLILGSGGASKTVCHCAKLLNASKIFIATRKNFDEITLKQNYVNYVDYSNLPKDIDIIINTTPLGSQNYINESPIDDLAIFSKCKKVIDLVYNPYTTKLMYEASKLGISAYNGLAMLVAQGTKSGEFFIGVNFLSYNNKIIRFLSEITQNIVLIGMSGSGKSHFGREVAKALNRKFIDIDEDIENKLGRTIDDIFTSDGEDFFREVEQNFLREAMKGNGNVIATGGGIIENPTNHYLLKSKGIVIHLHRNLNKISFETIFGKKSRPLYPSFETWRNKYDNRIETYHSLSDITVENTKENITLNEILERINQYYEKTYINK